MYLRPSTSRALRAALRFTTPPPAARSFTTTIPRTTSQKSTSGRQRARSFPEQAADTRASATLPPSTAPAYPASASPGQHGHVPRLHGKVALITGASSGLGRAVALAYASHGAKLVVCADLRPDPLGDGVEEGEEAALATHELINRKFGTGRAAFARCDVGVAAEVREAVEMAARDGGGRLDIIVNNAGLGTKNRYIRVHEGEDEEFDRVMYATSRLRHGQFGWYYNARLPSWAVEAFIRTRMCSEQDAKPIRTNASTGYEGRTVNVRGVYLGCKYACAQFLKQGPDATGRRGWIVNVASMLGYVGITGGAAAYCASKGAVLNMTKQIAVDYASDKIHCNALCPGFTKTSMTRENFTNTEVNAEMISTTPWGEWGNVSDVAKGAVFLASDDAAWVTGIGLPVDGGYLAQ